MLGPCYGFPIGYVLVVAQQMLRFDCGERTPKTLNISGNLGRFGTDYATAHRSGAILERFGARPGGSPAGHGVRGMLRPFRIRDPLM